MPNFSELVGRGWAFPVHIDARRRIATATDDADIRQAIRIILSTSLGERVMRPQFGSRLYELVFEPANEVTARRAERYVTEALERWEPRIELTDVTATADSADYGMLLIEVTYRIKSTHDQRSLVYPFYTLPE
ncbi:MAG: GPW/gp25 family protein [Anaerolineae bacterium]|nr:GPW/gp25 family protein [Anaerolineae bacterium]